MLGALKAWRRARILQASALPETAWRAAVARLSCLARLSEVELARLKQWVILFLHGKQVHGAKGYEPDEGERLMIAAQACLLILNLDLDYYRGWVEVIVYPGEFVPRREFVDEAGVVHVVREPLAGESWLRGPVILSAEDVEPAADGSGINVVIHEFAHKLDMLNGDADGMPPLHRGMDRRAWNQAFTRAYQDLCQRADRGEATALDPYGAESPGEFFAVASEAFFEIPGTLRQAYPEVYSQLREFYRQDPAASS